MWGSDWTKLSVGGVRWYLLTVIDFFSRWIVAWEVVPTVHGGTIKAIYQAGLKSQGLSIQSQTKPELRVDRGSPNTSGITQEFFEALGAELSFARVRRPTDNAFGDLDVAIRIKFREEEGMTFRRGRSCDRFSEIVAN
jgi:putative transposase